MLVIGIVLLLLRNRRGRRLLNELEAAGLLNFEEGNLASINPNLSLEEQADLLPYDKKYEFPRENLILGKQLGAGAYGVVFKAIAQNILPDNNESTVAVKMANGSIDYKVRFGDLTFEPPFANLSNLFFIVLNNKGNASVGKGTENHDPFRSSY